MCDVPGVPGKNWGWPVASFLLIFLRFELTPADLLNRRLRGLGIFPLRGYIPVNQNVQAHGVHRCMQGGDR